MPASVRDRLHFALIAEAMATEKEEQRQEAVWVSPAELVRAGFLLGAVPRDAATEAELDRRAVGQIGLAERGRERFG